MGARSQAPHVQSLTKVSFNVDGKVDVETQYVAFSAFISLKSVVEGLRNSKTVSTKSHKVNEPVFTGSRQSLP